MKIIHRGQLPGEVMHRATCNYCKTVYEFRAIEGKTVSDQREGTYIVTRCPLCQNTVYTSL